MKLFAAQFSQHSSGGFPPSAFVGPQRRTPIAYRRLVVLGLAGFLGVSASATPPSAVPPAESDLNSPSAPNGPSGGPFSTIGRTGYLLGNMGGLRPLLSKYGFSLGLTETSEVLGNVTGGSRRGADYDGLTQMVLQMDTQRAFGLHGGTFNISGLQIHGRNLSADNLDTLQTASGIESDRSTRLWELWYQQKFLSEDRMDVKIGQQSLDQEFMVSQNALVFVNTMFGWPMVPSADLPGGGPAYPLSALGARLRIRPTDSLTLLAGVFNGSPVSNPNGDPQQSNPSGTTFALNGGVLAIAEIQYAYPSLGTMVVPGEAEPLSGVYRLGVWYDSQDFADQRYDANGLSLANPASNGVARSHSGDYSIYAVVDKMVWRDPEDEDGDRTISVFARAMGTPQTDRNLVDFSLNLGLTMREPIPHRGDDTLGIALGYAHVSGYARGLDRDTGFYGGSSYPVRGGETFIEATYQYQLAPWCQLQPDFQYTFNPGAGIPNPDSPGHRIKNEAVFGLRINITF